MTFYYKLRQPVNADTLNVSVSPSDGFNVVNKNYLDNTLQNYVKTDLTNFTKLHTTAFSDTAPLNPVTGDLWLNTSNGRLYIYYDDADSNQWIQPSQNNLSIAANNVNAAVVNTTTGATGLVTHDVLTGNTWYHSSIVSNFTANFTNVPTTDNRTNTVNLILAQGATPYMPTSVQINGSSYAVKWSTPHAGTANKTEVVTFILFQVNASWTVLGSVVTYI